MKIVSITIGNFRSIKTARKIPIGQTTTLLGPNNEGKSNILRALYIGISALRNWQETLYRARSRGGSNYASVRRLGQLYSSPYYYWETDFPIGLQGKEPEGKSIVTLEFLLSPPEIELFEVEIGSTLNGTLPIQISFSPKGFDASIAKQGRGHKTLNLKKVKIIAFVAQRTDIQYIPAVRTADHVNEIIERLVERELRPVEKSPEFQKAMMKVQELQAPILSALSASIGSTIAKFIPTLKSAHIANTNERRISAIRSSIDVIIDDGVPTPLRFKGDGMQSLAALAMMRHTSTGRS